LETLNQQGGSVASQPPKHESTIAVVRPVIQMTDLEWSLFLDQCRIERAAKGISDEEQLRSDNSLAWE
jgi:hypothetical protein